MARVQVAERQLSRTTQRPRGGPTAGEPSARGAVSPIVTCGDVAGCRERDQPAPAPTSQPRAAASDGRTQSGPVAVATSWAAVGVSSRPVSSTSSGRVRLPKWRRAASASSGTPLPRATPGADAIDRRDVGRERPPTRHDDRALGSVEHQRGELVAKVVTIVLRRTGTRRRLPQAHHLGSGSTSLRPVPLGEHRHHLAARVVDEAVAVESGHAVDRLEDPLGRVGRPADDEHGLCAGGAGRARRPRVPAARRPGPPGWPVAWTSASRPAAPGPGRRSRRPPRATAGDAARRPVRRGSLPVGAGGRPAARRRPGASAGCGRGASAATAASARFPTPTRYPGRCAPRRPRRRPPRCRSGSAGAGCRGRLRRRVSSRPW